MNLHTRYQSFCSFCSTTFESNTIEQSVLKTQEHETQKHNKIFTPVDFSQVHDNAEECPLCKKRSMFPFGKNTSETARQCMNVNCAFIQRRIKK